MATETAVERRVLVLTASGTDGREVENLLAGAALQVRICQSAENLMRELKAGAGAAIVGEEALESAEARRIGETLAEQPAWSDLPMILLTVSGQDTGPLAERLTRSGHGHLTVLERPIRSSALLAAVKTALRSRLRQYQVRDELARRLESERVLRESEDTFAAIFETTTLGVAQAEPATRRLLRVNDAFCEITGYSREELLRLTVDELNHPDDRARDREAYARMETGQSREYQSQKRYVRKDGEIVWVHASGSIIRDATGRPVRAISIVHDVTGRVRAEEALRESETFKNTVLAASLTGLYVFDASSGRNVYVNPQYTKVTGYALADLHVLDRSAFLELFHCDDRAAVVEHMEAVIASAPGREFEIEYRFKRADGCWIWCLSRDALLPGAAGASDRCFVGTFLDITERKQAEDELRRAYGLIEGITQGTEDMIAAEDGDFRYLYFNDAYRRAFQRLWRRDIKVGTSMLQALAPWPEEQRKARELWSRALNGEAFTVTTALGPSDAGRAIYELRGNPICDAQGRRIGAAHIFRDITERVRVEQALTQSEERFRAVFEHAATGIAITDWQGRFEQCNAAYAAMLGYGEAEFRQIDFPSLVHPDDREANLVEVRRLQRGEIPSFEIENRYVRKDGQPVWVHKFVSVLRGSRSGVPEHLVALVTDVTERRRGEEALRESETRFRVMADNLPHLVWLHDARGRQEFVNQTFCDYFGVTRDDLRDDRWRMLIHPDDQTGYLADFEACVRERRPFHREVRVQRADRAWRWMESWGRPRFSEAGEFLGHVGTSADVTDRKAMEQRAEQQRGQLEAIYDAMSDGLMVYDAAGEVLLVNEAQARLAGYGTADEMKHDIRHFAEVFEVREIDGRSVPVEAWPAARVLRGESFANLEMRVRRRDLGEESIISFSGQPVYDHGARPILAVVISRDVTDRNRADAALRERESFYRQTLESIPGMTFANTPDGACDYVSEQWLEFTGVPAREHLGDGWQLLVHPDDRARAVAAWRAAVEGDGQYDLEYRIRRHDGEYGWFKVRGRAIRDASGAIVRWIGTAVGVDDLKQAEAALKEADRRKDEFLAMLAHELRNPLAPIRNAVEVLRQLGPKEPRLERSRDIIVRQVSHLARLVDDLLDVSRITRGKIILQKEQLAVREIVEAAVEAASPVLAQHEQTLSVQVSDGPCVWGDRARLVQVVTNLLTNAAKFSPSGGHITVWTKTIPDAVTIFVRDTGPGIPTEAQGRIFDLFRQEHVSLERTQGGLGIGLTLVKQLVEMHGGSVRVRSEGPGTGAEFAVTLPVPQTGAIPVGEPEARGEGRPRGRLRLLIVEDNADAAESFRMLLELDGHEVHVASDGRKGLRAIDELAPDVAFVDLGLPGIDGLTVARRVREQHPRRPLLVAVSGYGREEDKRQAREAGFDEHMTKPVDLEAVRTLLVGVGAAIVLDEPSRLVH